LAERAVAFCILAQTGRERTPIGMLTAVPAYASPYPGDTAKLGFVWYLSAAPAEHYAARGLRRVSGVAYALLDIAIQTRLDLGESAAIFLHADPAGGEQLIAFYVDKCGMTRLWDNKPISLVRQVRAGEYLAMTHAQAMQFAARFDSFRTA
jgi:hypothetical protein